MASRTLNVLLTADSKGMAQGFASSIKSSMGLKAGLAAAALGAAALGKAIYDVGEEFDDASDTIRVSTGKTGKQLEKLEGDFKNVVSSVPTDFEAAAEAVGELNKRLGITGKPLRERSKQFLELSRITNTDVAENIKTVTRAFGDWEVGTGKQGKQLDKFFRASQLSGASVSELAGEVVKFGAPLRQIGMSLDEATAMFASFEKAGVNTSTMLPGLKQAMKVALQEDKDPAKFIKAAFKGIEDGSVSSAKALELFGTRAGGDMIEAIQQGRFHLDAFTKTIATGNDTIRKAGKETMDTSENMQLLGNKIKVLVAPAAEWLYTAVGDLSKAFATMNFKPLLRGLGLSSEEMKSVGAVARGMGQVWQSVVLPLIKGAVGSIKNQLQGFANFMKSIVRIVGGVLRGDFGEAWAGVKDLFRTGVDFAKGLMKGMTAPMRLAAKGVDAALTGVFGGTWKSIKGIFSSGANAAIDVLNAMIGLMNKIPFVEIGTIGHLGGGGSKGGLGKTRGANTYGKQRGGPINLGAASGDSVPAMLERGEYVLNRNAVRAVGTRTLDAINYGAAPRFQKGGPVYMSVGGDIVGAVKDAAGYTPPGLLYKGAKAAWSKGFPAVQGAISGITGLGEKFPNWIDGSYFVDAAIEWLKGKTQAQAKERSARAAAGGSSYTGPPANMKQLGDNAWVDSHTLAVASFLMKKFGVSINSTYRSPEHNAAVGGVPGSLHTHGSPSNPGAIDFGPPSTAMQAFVGSHIAGIEENLIHDVGSGLHNHVGFFQGGGVVGTIGSILLRNGLDREAAAGIIGNAYGESSWNPGAIEPGTHNGGLWGFTASPVSLAELKAYAESQGKPWTSAAIQTQFMLHHLSGSQRKAMNSLDSVADTTEWFMANWERPASMASLPTRISAGQKALKMLGSGKGAVKKEPKFKAGHTGKGGGTYGSPAGPEKSSKTTPARMPGLGKAPLPKSAEGLPAGIKAQLQQPGLTEEERYGLSEFAINQAGRTKGFEDDEAALNFQQALLHKREAKLKQAIADINRQLRQKLTKKERQRLLSKRGELLGELSSTRESIGTNRQTLREGPEAAGVGGEEDPLQAAMEAQTKAIEEQKQIEEEHTAAIKGLQAQMKEQTDFAKSAVAESAVSGMMAVADMLSGMLGGSVQQAQALAGAGSVGSVGRF